jgi:benzoate transport
MRSGKLGGSEEPTVSDGASEDEGAPPLRNERRWMATYSARGSTSVRPYVTVREQPDASGGDDAGWTPRQLLVVAICFAINMIDGMDVLILSYIAQALSGDWGIRPDELGVVLSAGLAGMAAGGLLIAPLADRFGRRRIILAALLMMTVAMFGTAAATSIPQLILGRFVVGMGIGTVLAAMAALTAEYAPPKHRTFAVAFLQAGYPIGATATGFVVAALLPHHGWQMMLLGAACICAVAFPLVFFVLPESIDFLVRRQPKNALSRVNALRRALRQPVLDALPLVAPVEADRGGVRGLFAQGRASATLLLWVSIMLGFMTLYFVISWIPKLAIEAGLAPTDAIYAGATYNIGAFTGIVAIGLAASRVELRKLIFGFMTLAAIALTIFGSVAMPLAATLGVAFLIGVFVQGGFNGLYPLAAGLYPPEMRGTGIGWAMGIGRIGAVTGPMLGGVLLAAKASLGVIFAVFAVPMLLAGLCISLVRAPAVRD